MTLLLLAAIATLVALVLVAFATHVTRIARDRPLRSPQSHRVDGDFLPPSRLV